MGIASSLLHCSHLLRALRAASVRFANGSTHDVAILTGSEAYVSAMKHWQSLGTKGYLSNARRMSVHITWQN